MCSGALSSAEVSKEMEHGIIFSAAPDAQTHVTRFWLPTLDSHLSFFLSFFRLQFLLAVETRPSERRVLAAAHRQTCTNRAQRAHTVGEYPSSPALGLTHVT